MNRSIPSLLVVFSLAFFSSGCGESDCEDGFVFGDDGNCYPDQDADGFTAGQDCDDHDAAVSPNEDDIAGDDIDQNCDGVDGIDADGDGEAGIDSGGTDCDDTDASVLGEDEDGDGVPWCADCDDTDPALFPGAVESCDGFDENCDGHIDLGDDGVGVCSLETLAAEAMDVLLIVDNSCSMSEEQARLSSNVANIVEPFLDRGTDFHLGVVSTDMIMNSQAGKLQTAAGLRWVDQNTPDPVATAAQMIVLGTGGSADERGRDAAYAAIEIHGGAGGYNEGFIRPDADLAMIVISDENDHSSAVGAAEFVNWAQMLKAGPVVSFHSIVSPQPLCTSAAEEGTEYLGLTTAIGGASTSICESDYSPLLDDIAQNWAPIPIDAGVELPYAVLPSSLAAMVTTPEGDVTAYAAEDLTLDAPALLVFLPEIPPAGSTIQVWFAPDTP